MNDMRTFPWRYNWARQHQTSRSNPRKARSTFTNGLTTAGRCCSRTPLILRQYAPQNWARLPSERTNSPSGCQTGWGFGGSPQLSPRLGGDIEQTQGTALNYLLADEDQVVAKLYGMIHPKADPKLTVRTVFIIDSDKKIRLTLTYPPSTGRNVDGYCGFSIRFS